MNSEFEKKKRKREANLCCGPKPAQATPLLRPLHGPAAPLPLWHSPVGPTWQLPNPLACYSAAVVGGWVPP
jgi:hypothetical protein